MTLYWDDPTRVAASAYADSSGNFTTHVKPFSGDALGVHRLCASVPPNPCANFDLQAATTSPSPDTSPTPSPDTSPSPTASPSASPSSTPVAATVNGLDVLMKPPFVILPIVGGIGLAIALGYWILSVVLRPRPQTLKSVAVSHLASRPDYSAGFGTPPSAPAASAPPPSAWPEAVPPTAAAPPPSPETTAADAMMPDAGETPHPDAPPSADTQWTGDTGAPAAPEEPDEPPDLPEPGDE